MKIIITATPCEAYKLVRSKTKDVWPYTMLTEQAYTVIFKEIVKLVKAGIPFYEAEERVWNNEQIIGPVLGFNDDKYEVSLPCTMTLCTAHGNNISIPARYHLYTYQVYSRQLADALRKLGTKDTLSAIVRFPHNQDAYFCFPSDTENIALSHWTVCNMNGPLAECLPF